MFSPPTSNQCVGYLYPGIRAKRLMSVTSPHPMVKDATAASSDPQRPGHASSDSEDEISASSDPKAWAPTPRTRFPPHPTPRRGLRLRGRGFRLVRPQGVGSDSSDPRARAPTRPVPRGGLRLIRPLRVRFRLARPAGQDFRLARSMGSDLLPDKSSGPRVVSMFYHR